ncbi:hypothetical protein ADUPG1_007084, partial [Aduncisulcus paluster]
MHCSSDEIGEREEQEIKSEAKGKDIKGSKKGGKQRSGSPSAVKQAEKLEEKEEKKEDEKESKDVSELPKGFPDPYLPFSPSIHVCELVSKVIKVKGAGVIDAASTSKGKKKESGKDKQGGTDESFSIEFLQSLQEASLGTHVSLASEAEDYQQGQDVEHEDKEEQHKLQVHSNVYTFSPPSDVPLSVSIPIVTTVLSAHICTQQWCRRVSKHWERDDVLLKREKKRIGQVTKQLMKLRSKMSLVQGIIQDMSLCSDEKRAELIKRNNGISIEQLEASLAALNKQYDSILEYPDNLGPLSLCSVLADFFEPPQPESIALYCPAIIERTEKLIEKSRKVKKKFEEALLQYNRSIRVCNRRMELFLNELVCEFISTYLPHVTSHNNNGGKKKRSPKSHSKSQSHGGLGSTASKKDTHGQLTRSGDGDDGIEHKGSSGEKISPGDVLQHSSSSLSSRATSVISTVQSLREAEEEQLRLEEMEREKELRLTTLRHTTRRSTTSGKLPMKTQRTMSEIAAETAANNALTSFADMTNSSSLFDYAVPFEEFIHRIVARGRCLLPDGKNKRKGESLRKASLAQADGRTTTFVDSKRGNSSTSATSDPSSPSSGSSASFFAGLGSFLFSSFSDLADNGRRELENVCVR